MSLSLAATTYVSDHVFWIVAVIAAASSMAVVYLLCGTVAVAARHSRTTYTPRVIETHGVQLSADDFRDLVRGRSVQFERVRVQLDPDLEVDQLSQILVEVACDAVFRDVGSDAA